MKINFHCSEDQRYAIEEHLFNNAKLTILPSERMEIYNYCKWKFPDMRISNAHLNLETIEWEITLEGASPNEKKETPRNGPTDKT